MKKVLQPRGLVLNIRIYPNGYSYLFQAGLSLDSLALVSVEKKIISH